jgi:hypothetical protein
MSFSALAEASEKLRNALRVSTGQILIAEVSLEPPGNDPDEAAFIKLVLWGFVLWYEACQPTGRYLMSIVRNASPEHHKAASRAFQDVQNLRTFQTHNLLSSNASDQYKLSQAKAWLAQNGGPERDWGRCLNKLCSDLTLAFNMLYNHWIIVTSSPEDAVAAIKGLISALEREWEPHLFDSMIEEAASTLGLLDFNPVKYRGTRLDEWRKITDLFLDRTGAEAAVRRAIYQEMSMKFGAASPPSLAEVALEQSKVF